MLEEEETDHKSSPEFVWFPDFCDDQRVENDDQKVGNHFDQKKFWPEIESGRNYLPRNYVICVNSKSFQVFKSARDHHQPALRVLKRKINVQIKKANSNLFYQLATQTNIYLNYLRRTFWWPVHPPFSSSHCIFIKPKSCMTTGMN